jgi:hypothetical protein
MPPRRVRKPRLVRSGVSFHVNVKALSSIPRGLHHYHSQYMILPWALKELARGGGTPYTFPTTTFLLSLL